jgi:hypothetical protein
MTSVVPEPDYWLRQVVLVAQRTQARGAQQETAGCGIEPDRFQLQIQVFVKDPSARKHRSGKRYSLLV